MDYRLVVDSCCELLPELREKLFAKAVPLIMKLGDDTYVDDEKLDINNFLDKMKAYKGQPRSACPSPGDYAEQYRSAVNTFVLTISSNLSGSYNSAVMGKRLLDESEPYNVHVFDSKSASAGQLLIAMKICEFVESKLEVSEIIRKVEEFIDGMKTFFVLENLDNLIKNGRMSLVAARIASVLGIRPILGSDGNGNIALYSKARGADAAMDKLASTIGEHCEDTSGKTLVITHCNNQKQANKLHDMIQSMYQFKRILVQPTGGLSSMYANNGGIIIAF